MTPLEIKAVKFRNALSRAFPSDKAHHFTSAIITAAGSGIRMGGVSKQLFPILGKPCIVYSLLAFQESSSINEIIITAKPEEIERIQRICREHQITKLAAVVPGGKTRQESVANGFQYLHKKSEIVAIHDGARPLITKEDIDLLVKKAARCGASCAANRMVDTVKKADVKGYITETVPREELFTVQTPQVFQADIYRVSLALAARDHLVVTDDCSILEHAGFPIFLCETGKENIKLTTQQDLELITAILKERSHV